MIKIQIRFVTMMAGVVLFILLLNLSAILMWSLKIKNNVHNMQGRQDITETLKKQNETYTMPQESMTILKRQYQWAMLIGNDGNILWSYHLPDDLLLTYTIQDVARFSKWYLKDYPVYTYIHEDGIVVYGNARGSLWKTTFEAPEKYMREAPKWLMVLFLTNILIALSMVFFLGLRFFRSLRALAGGIEEMSGKKIVKLEKNGLLGDLAASINSVSQELYRQQEIIDEKNAARTSWIAGVSHDIRTPLSVVMGYASQLEENPDLSDEEQMQAGIIRKQSHRIKRLVDNLNLTSKLEYEMQPLFIDAVPVAQILRKVIAEFLNHTNYEAYPISLIIAPGSENIILEGDKNLLERALCNVIGNSVEHNENGCEITVILKKKESGCCVIVSDTGNGFSRESLEGLHQEKPMDLSSAHGLGLKIVKQIVKVHDGSVVFENIYGGSQVSLYFRGAKKR